jgi:hypothetical protein
VQLVYAIIAVVVATVVASVVTNKVTISKLKNDAESKLGNAEAKAREIIDDAIKTAEATKKESLLEVKEESIKAKNELEKETKERRAELQRYEKRVLSKEEVLERIDREDPNRRSDAFMYAAPEIDENTPRLDEKSAKRRFLIMAHIAEKLLDDAVIKKLVDEMPRKKDGTFAKNKILRIASSRIVQFPCDILEIFAKADTDTSFAVTAEFRKFSSEEVALLEFDFISRNSNILGLQFE